MGPLESFLFLFVFTGGWMLFLLAFMKLLQELMYAFLTPRPEENNSNNNSNDPPNTSEVPQDTNKS